MDKYRNMQCKVCMHPHRMAIERAWRSDIEYSEILEQYPELTDKGIKRHMKNHSIKQQNAEVDAYIKQKGIQVVNTMEKLQEQMTQMDQMIQELQMNMNPIADDYIQKVNALRQLWNAKTAALKLHKDLRGDRKQNVQEMGLIDFVAMMKELNPTPGRPNKKKKDEKEE